MVPLCLFFGATACRAFVARTASSSPARGQDHATNSVDESLQTTLRRPTTFVWRTFGKEENDVIDAVAARFTGGESCYRWHDDFVLGTNMRLHFYWIF